MAITDKIYRLAFGGTFFEDEEWSMSVILGSLNDIISTPQSFQALIEAFVSTMGCRFNGGTKLGWIKFNKLDPVTGHYANPTETQEHIIAPEIVTPGNFGPAQIAIVATLGTAAARGRGSKGRIYIPAGLSAVNTAGGISQDGRLTEADAAACAEGVATFLSALNLFGDQKVRVYSKAGQVANPVTHVKVGRVVDTQRRRRSDLSEDYQSHLVDQ